MRKTGTFCSYKFQRRLRNYRELRVNNLNVCRNLEYILTEFPEIDDEKGNIDTSKPVHLLPWSEEVPEICHKPRR